MSFFSNIFGTTSGVDTPIAAAPIAITPPVVVPTEPVPPSSPFDTYKDLWEPNTTKEGVDGTLPANMFASTDPAKMLDAARKVDFAKSIPPEVLAKITAGGPEAAAAFTTALNDGLQRSYAQSSYATTKIVEAALIKFQEGLDNRLPDSIKRHAVRDSVQQSNPALQHPAAAPIIDALQAQFSLKYPKATTAELTQMATDYLVTFATIANPAKPVPAAKGEYDWSKV